MESQLNPIRREYSGLLSQTGSEREQALADLATRIAGVRTGALQSGISGAQSLYGTQYGGYQSALDRALQVQQAAKNRAFEAQQAALNRSNALKTAGISAGGGGSPTPSISTTKPNYLPTAISTLSAAGNRDIYVDANEANLAYRSLVSRGIPASQAKKLITQAMKQGGFKAYGNWSL